MISVGICLSGHTRNFSSVPHFLKLRDILQQHEISTHFYVSTWNNDGYWVGLYEQTKVELDEHLSILKILNAEAVEIENHTSFLIQTEVESVAEKFKDVIIDARPYVVFDQPHKTKINILHNFRKKERSFRMVTNYHDVLVRGRFDICFNEINVADSIIKIIKNKLNTIIVPSNFSFGGKDHDGGGRMCDSFAIGSFEVMKKFFDIYSCMSDGVITPEYLTKNNIWFCPHSILRNRLLMGGIDYTETDDFGYFINREKK